MIDRRTLLQAAARTYSLLTVVACVLAWLLGVDLVSQLRLEWNLFVIGALGVIPMSIAFLCAPDLKERVVDLLGQALAQCRNSELFLLAVMAGVSEELLFRGALEGWLQTFSPIWALVITNLLFGLCHPLTVGYFIIATLLGAFLSLLAEWGPGRQLVAPIVAHTLYDFVGFLMVARSYRKAMLPSPMLSQSTPD